MSLLLLFRPHAGDGPPPEPQPEEQAQVPAGRKRRERKYIIEIDGREFVADSAQEAINLLDKAQAIAQRIADQQVAQAVEKGLPTAIRLGAVPRVTPKPLQITGSLPIYKELQAAKERINRIYRDAAIAAELRLLMALEAERDEEEAILLSL